MNHPRHHFFSHAALAADEYRHVHRRNLQNLLPDFQHLRAGRQERKVLGQLFAIFPERLVLRTQLLLLPHLQKCSIQLRLLERFRQVVERAQPDRFHHRRHFVRARKHDDIQRAVQLHQLPQCLEAIDFRHQHIENHEIGTFARPDFLQRLFAARHCLYRETVHLEKRLQILPYARFVVYHQNFFFVGHYVS